MSTQLPNRRGTRRTSRRLANPPDGFLLVREALDVDGEAALVAHLAALTFDDVHFHGVVARRKVLHFGTGYAYAARALAPAAPIPEWLEPLRARAAQWTGIPASDFAEVLVTRYPPGAGIGWHRDAPVFGPSVVGVSLLASCTLRLRLAVGTGWERFDLELPPRSGYVLGGPARAAWQHSIPPVRESRYSITLRTLVREPAS